MTRFSQNNTIGKTSSQKTGKSLKVGITGGIGSGKSTVAHLYEMMNYPVYYADQCAKFLTENDAIVKEQLVNYFGKQVYPDQLDRKALADIVFSDSAALEQLNNIIHPAVERNFNHWCKQQDAPIVFKEAAILFESGTYKTVNKIICITAPEELRITRVMQRDECSIEQVKGRIKNQWTDKEKLKRSDYIITADDKQLVIPQALKILENISLELK